MWKYYKIFRVYNKDLIDIFVSFKSNVKNTQYIYKHVTTNK